MAAALFYTWEHLGRPLEPAQPVRDIVDRLKVAFPRAAGLFGWHADEAHYTAVPPQDHTPFSTDGWPAPDPQWWVCATDVMHRPDLGVDCAVLFRYWIAEAKAGRMPWLKYIIWQATIYDVRHGWKAQPSVGHADHIHLSTRTDHLNTHLGSWPLVPEEDDMATPLETWSINAGSGTNPVRALDRLNQIARDAATAAAGAAADATRDAALLAAIVAMAGHGGPDAAPIVAAITSAAEASRTQVAQLRAEVAELKAKLAAAAHAEADALDH